MFITSRAQVVCLKPLTRMVLHWALTTLFYVCPIQMLQVPASDATILAQLKTGQLSKLIFSRLALRFAPQSAGTADMAAQRLYRSSGILNER